MIQGNTWHEYSNELKLFLCDVAKSRWASCSTLNNINYSWRLALAPEFVIRYIVAHEVSHLKHQDHSAHFWALVEYLEEV